MIEKNEKRREKLEWMIAGNEIKTNERKELKDGKSRTINKEAHSRLGLN